VSSFPLLHIIDDDDLVHVGPVRSSSEEQVEDHAIRPVALVPIRVEFETDTHRVRDCFVWNLHERLVTPEQFARTFCADLDLPATPWADTVAAQIRAQLEDQDGVGSMELAVDGGGSVGDEVPECRVILSVCHAYELQPPLTLTWTLQIDVQVDNHHLLDHIEWDLRSGLTPEEFTHQLCLDLGLAGEAEPLIAHAVHEELMRHKKDAIEWGVIGGFPTEQAATTEDGTKDKSGLGLMKDKTGLGLGWGRTPKEGRGPRILRSVWRDWAEAEEFKTRWEMLSQEEVERREIERERASRCVSIICGSLDVARLADRVIVIDGCGERHQNSRVRPGRKGYDTSVSGTITIFFWARILSPYNGKGLPRLYGDGNYLINWDT
jgi:chromatin structure-remodeling complex subunit SFH1